MSRGSRALAAALVSVLSVTAFTPVLFADAYDAAIARAIAAKEKAVDSNDPAQWEEALRLFTEADAIRATKDSKYELASAAVRLKEDDIAFEAFEAAIALGIAGKAKEKAQVFLKAHEGLVGRLDVKGPAGAELFVGARRRGTLPRPTLVVFAGAAKVRATHNGQTVEQVVTIKEGATASVDLGPAFVTKPAAPASASAAPSAAPTAKEEGSPTVPLSDTGGAARTLGWSLVVGGGIVTIAGGAGLIVSTRGISDGRASLDSHCITRRTDDPDQCFLPRDGLKTEAQQDNNNIRTWKAVRTAALVTGGVGIMIMSVGIVRLLTAPTPPRASAWVPRVDVGVGYVGLSGVF